MQPHEAIHKNPREIFVNNFVGGIAWGLGATVGLGVVVAMLGLIFQWVDVVPIIGDFVAEIVKFVEKK